MSADRRLPEIFARREDPSTARPRLPEPPVMQGSMSESTLRRRPGGPEDKGREAGPPDQGARVAGEAGAGIVSEERCDSTYEWPVSFAAAAREHLRAALACTPAQRLEWLEDMIQFAHAAGVLPRPRDPAD